MPLDDMKAPTLTVVMESQPAGVLTSQSMCDLCGG